MLYRQTVAKRRTAPREIRCTWMITEDCTVREAHKRRILVSRYGELCAICVQEQEKHEECKRLGEIFFILKARAIKKAISIVKVSNDNKVAQRRTCYN